MTRSYNNNAGDHHGSTASESSGIHSQAPFDEAGFIQTVRSLRSSFEQTCMELRVLWNERDAAYRKSERKGSRFEQKNGSTMQNYKATLDLLRSQLDASFAGVKAYYNDLEPTAQIELYERLKASDIDLQEPAQPSRPVDGIGAAGAQFLALPGW